MQQRPTNSSRAPADQCLINITQQPPQPKSSPRWMDESSHLPVYFCHSRKVAEKLVHAIPLILLLCFFILWWFSYPVNLEIKEGRIVAIHRVEMPLPLNFNPVELAILTSATSPIASIPQNFMTNNETEVHQVNETD